MNKKSSRMGAPFSLFYYFRKLAFTIWLMMRGEFDESGCEATWSMSQIEVHSRLEFDVWRGSLLQRFRNDCDEMLLYWQRRNIGRWIGWIRGAFWMGLDGNERFGRFEQFQVNHFWVRSRVDDSPKSNNKHNSIICERWDETFCISETKIALFPFRISPKIACRIQLPS